MLILRDSKNDQLPKPNHQISDSNTHRWSLGFGHWSFHVLSAPNQRHDFHAIAIIQDRLAVLRPRNDFEFPLHRHMRLRDAQLAEQISHAAARGNFAALSVDLYVHPERSTGKLLAL